MVIGAGPVGAAAAWRLASHGIGVTCVEQGDWFPDSCPPPDAPRFAELKHKKLHTNPNIRAGPADIPIDDKDSAIKPALGNNVGGSSLYWAAHAPRFRPDDFTVRDTDGVAENWPLRYADLAPYYGLNETMTGVAYVSGDPTIPRRMPSATEYPFMNEATRWIAGVLASRNWHAWPTDIVVGRPKERCSHEGWCNVGCATRRASGADRNYLPAATSRGARLLTETRSLLLSTIATGALRLPLRSVTATGSLSMRKNTYWRRTDCTHRISFCCPVPADFLMGSQMGQGSLAGDLCCIHMLGSTRFSRSHLRPQHRCNRAASFHSSSGRAAAPDHISGAHGFSFPPSPRQRMRSKRLRRRLRRFRAITPGILLVSVFARKICLNIVIVSRYQIGSPIPRAGQHHVWCTKFPKTRGQS